MDSTNRYRHNLITKMLQTHLKKIRENRLYKKVHIFVFIEANYGGWWATDIVRGIVEQKEFAPIEVCSYDETDKNRVGVWMRDEVKECMAGEMQRSLADGQLCFADAFITQRDTKAIQHEFMEQLQHYRQEIIVPTDESTGKYKKVTTGKSAGRKDDMCICAQIALYFSGKKRIDNNFRSMAVEYGWRY